MLGTILVRRDNARYWAAFTCTTRVASRDERRNRGAVEAFLSDERDYWLSSYLLFFMSIFDV